MRPNYGGAALLCLLVCYRPLAWDYNFFAAPRAGTLTLSRAIERRKGVRKTIGTHAKACESHSLPRTVNGTGHTGPSEFCATSI